jgi:excisionase family DNA binding protein
MTNQRTWVTIAEAAELLALHQNTVRNLIRQGKLPASRIGSHIVRIKQADIDALLTPYVGGEYGVWSR